MAYRGDSAFIGGTVRERAVTELRDRILTGVWPVGTRLDLDAITTEFRTSRTPVREALLQLSYEGLVAITPRSRVTVIGGSPAGALDSFALLGVLSGKAAEWAAERCDDAELEELTHLAESMSTVGETELAGANWRFHRAIHRAARSPQLLTLIRQAVRAVPSNFFDVFPDQQGHSHAEHRALAEALVGRDGPAARIIMENHVNSAGASLAEWLRERVGNDVGSTAPPTDDVAPMTAT